MSARIEELKAANALLKQGLMDYAEKVWWQERYQGRTPSKDLETYVNDAVKDYTYFEIEDDPILSVAWRNYDKNDTVGCLGMP